MRHVIVCLVLIGMDTFPRVLGRSYSTIYNHANHVTTWYSSFPGQGIGAIMTPYLCVP
jgi:hypothetical protein